jgi:hypothetical protein
MTTIAPKTDILVRRMGQEMVLLNLKNETYYILNVTGIQIWEMLAGGSTIEGTVAILSVKYDIASDTLRGNLNNLIQELYAAQLVDFVN